MSLAKYVKLIREGKKLPRPEEQTEPAVEPVSVVVSEGFSVENLTESDTTIISARFTVVVPPLYGAMKPHDDSAVMAAWIAAENRIWFRGWHRLCRNGRHGPRPAHDPKYKDVRRGGIRFRKHVRPDPDVVTSD